MTDGSAIEPFGDAAVLIRLDERAYAEPTTQAHAIAAVLEDARRGTVGLGQPVAALTSVLVPFDPLQVELEDVAGVAEWAIARAGAVAGELRGSPPIEIPVRYGGADGPDLDSIAELHGLTPADVVELHAGARYHVLFLGFAPGFAYLGGLPAAIATPRRANPRERVPAGSVGIAGEQTGVYPRSMPGGWQLIGRTDVALFDPDRSNPALLEPGAVVRFVPARP